MLFGLELGVLLPAGSGLCLAQAVPPVRGMYTPGFNATNSGVMPEPGFTYANSFMDYSFDQFRSASGAIVAQNNAAVFMDINAFEWVTKKKILGANYALAALLPFTNSSISSPTLGDIGGGGGFSERTSVSAYQLYEFHTTQQGTNIDPGQTFNLDYSLMQILPLQEDMHTLLQFGLVGDGQWQTSNNSGPGIDPANSAHYRVNAIGGSMSGPWRVGRPSRCESVPDAVLHQL